MHSEGNRSADEATGRPSASGVSTAGKTAVVSLAFWTAVALPPVMVGVLLGGIATPEGAAKFLGILVLEVLALLIGRTYGRE